MMPLLMVALAAAIPSRSLHPAWMVGSWGWSNPGERGNDCGTDHDTTYERDGTYYFLDEVGTWRIEGDRLIESEPGAPGKSIVRRFVKVRPGVLRIKGPQGGTMTKCRY